MLKIIKRNGKLVDFDKDKIEEAIIKAMEETEVGVDEELAYDISNVLYTIYNSKKVTPNVEDVQDDVEIMLARDGRFDVSKRYILYREERAKLRNQGWEMTELQRDIYQQKYRLSNECFDDFLERVSGGNQPVKKLIKDQKFIPAGRVLAGRGLNENGRSVTLSNCYVMPKVEDNIESIFDTAKWLARTYSYGGGVGLAISKLRPKGALVRNSAHSTTGATSFMDLYSMVTGLIGQKGRRGALMLNIDVNHPDIEEFIDIKNHDAEKVRFANISVNMTKEFMEAVERDDNFELRFEVEATGEVISKIIKAKDLFRQLAENNHNMAEPGILYQDRIDSWHLMSEDGEFEFAGVNPCVTGDTLILTDVGYIRIDSVIGDEVNVWNGFEYSKVTPKITGYDEKMRLVKFNNGNELKCTHYHKFIMKNGDRIQAKDLEVGDKLAKWGTPIIDVGEDIDEKLAYTQGFFAGDGSYEKSRGRNSIDLHGDKRELIGKLEYIKSYYCPSFEGEYLRLSDDVNIFNKDFVPHVNYSIQSRLDWLAGYIDSDGTLQSIDGGISISSTDRDRLVEVKYMLDTLGCNVKVTMMYESNNKLMPKNDGTGDSKIYECQESYRLLISATNVKKLMDLGLRTHRVELIANPNRDASRFITIESIEDIKDEPIVYCFDEPKNHSGIFNGVMTAQCGEEPLPPFGSCNLSSINLSEFIKKPFTLEAYFDYVEFEKVVREGVIYLNEVLDENMDNHPLEQQKQVSADLRQIGLGIMGLADMFIMMGVAYGSEESVTLSREVARFMLNKAVHQSALLAKKDGVFPKFKKDKVLASPFVQQNCDREVIEMIETYGLRNSQILTIAPTGSISTMIGVSGGIEPIFQTSYTRKSETLHEGDTFYKVLTPIVKEYMDANDIHDEKDLPDFFVTSSDIYYKDRIEVQSAWQQYIDASISSTVNVPNDFSIEDVEGLYMYAWKRGLKGVTIYRDGCARGGVLFTETDDKSSKLDELQSQIDSLANDMLKDNPNECPMCGGEMFHSGGCSECRDCAYSPCSI